MKNLLFLMLGLCFSVSALCQSFSTGPNRTLHSSRNYTLEYLTPTQGVGKDTVKLSPRASVTHVVPSAALNDSLMFTVTGTANLRPDCELVVLAKADGSARKLRFLGNSWLWPSGSTAVYTLAANKTAELRFRWTGSAFLEVRRVVEQ